MRQTLFFIPQEVNGLPVFGFGWGLASWLLFVLSFSAWHLLRRQPSRDLFGLAPFAVAVSAAIAFLFPVLEVEGFGLPIRGYGVMMLIAVLAGVGVVVYRGRQLGFHPEQIYSLAGWMFGFGILGARLFYVIQNWDSFSSDSTGGTLAAIFKFTEGGLVVYGSLIGATLAFVYFTQRHRLPILRLADAVAPGLILGLAIGRIGCLLNGCCYGGICEAPLSITFPRYSAPQTLSPPYFFQLSQLQLHGLTISQDETGILRVASVSPGSPAAAAEVPEGAQVVAVNGIELQPHTERLAVGVGKKVTITTDDAVTRTMTLDPLPARSLPVHPTQLYSTFNGLLIFALAWLYFPFRKRDGEIFGIVLTVYPVTRILLEWVRTDEPGQFGTPFTISQLVSLGILAAMAFYWWAVAEPKRWGLVGSKSGKASA